RHGYRAVERLAAFRTRRVFPLHDLEWLVRRPPLGATSYPLAWSGGLRRRNPGALALYNLFFRHQPRVDTAGLLEPGERDRLVSAGILEPLGSGVQARLQVACAAGLYLMSSIPGRSPGEYVYLGDDTGVLLRETASLRGGRALDLGTGCGAVALRLDFEEVVGSDVNPTALALASGNAVLNRRSVRFLESDLWEKIPGRFSLITSNPPALPIDPEPGFRFVSAGTERPTELTLRILEGLGDFLEPEGTAFVLTFSPGRRLWHEACQRLPRPLSLEYSLREEFPEVGLHHVFLTVRNDGRGERRFRPMGLWSRLKRLSLPLIPPGPSPQALTLPSRRPSGGPGPPPPA
ncbi:MAG: methyltransferase, partial [Candidatus Eremiobacterota bacterium]